MYNRYIPGTDGVYERRVVQDPEKKNLPCQKPELPEPSCEQTACIRQDRPSLTEGPFHRFRCTLPSAPFRILDM